MWSQAAQIHMFRPTLKHSWQGAVHLHHYTRSMAQHRLLLKGIDETTCLSRTSHCAAACWAIFSGGGSLDRTS
jgi:hypothetical protein